MSSAKSVSSASSTLQAPISVQKTKIEMQRFEAFEKIQSVALPTIATLAGIYFGYEFYILGSLVSLTPFTCLTLGGLQEIFINLSLQEEKEKQRRYRVAAVSLGAISLLATSFYFVSLALSFQLIKIIAVSAHFFLACRALKSFDQSVKKPLHVPSYVLQDPRKPMPTSSASRPTPPRGFLFSSFWSRLPTKRTSIPKHPHGFCNVDGASCFFNATIKALLTSSSFKEKLNIEIKTSTPDISKADRELVRLRLKDLSDELSKDVVNPEVISKAWYALRYENEAVLRRFPAYKQDCAYELYVFFEQALGLNENLKSQLNCTSLIKLSDASPFREAHSGSKAPTSMLQLTSVIEEIKCDLYELSNALKEKYKSTQLKAHSDESKENLEKRQSLLNHMKNRPVILEDLLKFEFVKIGDGLPSIEDQLKTILDLEGSDSVSKLEHKIYQDKDPVSIQDLIHEAFKEETVEDFKEETERGTLSYPTIQKKLRLSHPNLDEFKEFSFQIKRFMYPDITKKSFGIKDLETEVELPVFNEATKVEKKVKLKLKAIVCHEGSYRTGGHYFTYKKEADGWYLHNDGSVSKIDEGKLQEEFKKESSVTPYLMLYDVVNPDEAAVEE
jgi:hypothetical protein